MKKNLLLLAAAVCALSASADYYVIGNGVNGKVWTLAAEDAKMTETATAGVYEWNGESLKSGFKINDGTWDNGQANFGNSGSALKLDTPYNYALDGDNIAIDGVEVLSNPKVVLDLNSKTITVTGKSEELPPVDPNPTVDYTTWYVNVLGGFNGWKDNGVKPNAEGIATVKDLDMGINADKGFKIKIWNGSDVWYSTGAEVALNTPVKIEGDADGNMVLAGATEGTKYDVTFNCATNEMTIVAQGGGDTPVDPSVEAPDALYVIGDYVGGYAWNPEKAVELTKDGDIFSGTVPVSGSMGSADAYLSFVTAVGADWDNDVNSSDRFGAATSDAPLKFNESAELVAYRAGVNASSAAAFKLDLGTTETVDVIFTVDFKNMKVTVKKAGTTGVAGIDAAEEAPVYFNLQGVQVAEPANGIFVKVVGGKATKVVVK